MTAKPGETVEVNVSLAADDVAGVELRVLFDDTALAFVEAEAKGFVAAMDQVVANNPVAGEVRLSAMSLSEISGDEVVMTITFTVLDEAADVNALTIGETFVVYGDANQTEQKLDLTNGAVNVVRGLKGDVNLDGEVDIYDAMRLFKHVNEEITLEGQALANGEVNGDGEIDIYDAMRLFKFVNEEIPEL